MKQRTAVWSGDMYHSILRCNKRDNARVVHVLHFLVSCASSRAPLS